MSPMNPPGKFSARDQMKAERLQFALEAQIGLGRLTAQRSGPIGLRHVDRAAAIAAQTARKPQQQKLRLAMLRRAPRLMQEPAAGIRAFVGGLADWFERSGFHEGCPITSIVLATAPQSRPHSEAARAVLKDWQRRLLAHSSRLGTNLSLADAELFLMLVEGAWILGRIQQSKEPLLRAAEVFLTLQ